MATAPEDSAETDQQQPLPLEGEITVDRQEASTSRQEASTSRQEITIEPEVISIPEGAEKPTPLPNFIVKEAYTKKSTLNEVHNENEHSEIFGRFITGTFSKLADAVQALFKRRKIGLKNPQVTPENGSDFFDPARTATCSMSRSNQVSKENDDTIIMRTINPNTSNTEDNHMQSSQIFNHSLSGFNPNTEDKSADDSSFESKIYSVNSAGKPIPITIENDQNEEGTDASSSDLSDEESRVGSRAALQPNPSRSYDFRKKCLKLWRRTYQPGSTFMYLWLLFITLVILYNAWVIPLRAGFVEDIQTPWRGAWFAIDAICDLTYIIDIFVKFRTRYLKHGLYVKDPTSCLSRHLKEWTIILDIISVFPTDLFFISTVNTYLRLNRLARVYRAYSFYRVVEIKTRWPNALRLTNLFHSVVLLLHYTACIYYSASLANGYGAMLSSWAYPNPSFYPEYAGLTRKYTHSFYWSIQQLSLIGNRAVPEADWQYVFTIYLNILGIALTAYIIGYVTTILLGKHSEKYEFERSMETTRKYMKRRRLPKELRRRVEQFYDYIWTKSEFSHLDEDKMLRHLPLAIKEEIAYQGNYNALKQLPELSHCDSSILKNLVSKLKRRTFLPGQFVCKSGDAGTEMFIVGEGLLQIIRERDGQVTGAKEGDIFGEMNIFNLRNNHRRTCDVVSCGYSELYVLTAKDVHDTLSQYPRVMNLIVQQAKREKALTRRKMSQNFYNRKHYRYFPSNDSSENVKFMNSPSNVQFDFKSTSAATRTTGQSSSSNNVKLLKSFNESPDSGLPSSPGHRKGSEAELSGISNWQTSEAEMMIPSELAEKLSHVYQKNLKAFQKSLDAVWFNEVYCVKQELANAETERDGRAREVSQLRQRMVSEKSKLSTNQRSSEVTIEEETPEKPKREKKANHNAKQVPFRNSKKWQSNVKLRPGTNSLKKRTLMPNANSAFEKDLASSQAETVT